MTTTVKRGLPRFYEYRDRLAGIIKNIEGSPEPNPVLLAYFKMAFAHDSTVIDCAENGKKFLSSWYGNAPEIYAAMNIPYYCVVENLLFHLLPEDLSGIDANIVPDDMCGLIKLGAYAVEKGLCPTPTAMIAMLEPCDAQAVLHEAWQNTEEWCDIPCFALDPAYKSKEVDYEHFAGELRRMIAFLEDHVGYKLDWNKLKEVIEETNRQYEVWAEYNQLRKAVPCPAPSFQAAQLFWMAVQHFKSGQPEATKLLKMMLMDSEGRYKEGKGALPKENARILWADLVGGSCPPIGDYLANEHSAVVVMDFQSYTPYLPIDTSTPESMLLGLSKRNMNEVPMIRQARGNVDLFLEDITTIVEEYKIDAVFFPGHVGHKDQSASIGFLREACRESGVPLLDMTMDIFDPRYLPIDKLSKIIDEFFETHELGKYKK